VCLHHLRWAVPLMLLWVLLWVLRRVLQLLLLWALLLLLLLLWGLLWLWVQLLLLHFAVLLQAPPPLSQLREGRSQQHTASAAPPAVCGHDVPPEPQPYLHPHPRPLPTIEARSLHPHLSQHHPL